MATSSEPAVIPVGMDTNDKSSQNDELVSEITKDMESLVVLEESENNDVPPPDPPESVESEEEPSASDDGGVADDEIDEDYLRELEKNKTDEEKAKLKESSLKLKEEGNTMFRDGDFLGAIKFYTQALQACPLTFTVERSILYGNRAAARSKLERTDEAILDCTKALELNPNYLKAVLRRAQLYQKMQKLDEALADYQRVLELDGNVLEAREAVMRLPEQINVRNEELKTEMMGKLKDLGNMFLRPFGLSTNNFNLVKDENTGGYSVNFQQNSGT